MSYIISEWSYMKEDKKVYEKPKIEIISIPITSCDLMGL